MSRTQTAVVILNWNGREFLKKFLPSVLQHTPPDVRVIVADNASHDDSVEMLKQEFPKVEIIQNETNGGFAKGYNDALALIEADYYILLNSDIEVTPKWIEPVISLMQKDSSVAACQPLIRSYSSPEFFEYAGAAGGFIDMFGYPFCRGRLFQSIEQDFGQYNDAREVFWATGACLFVRAELFRKHGGFDADFFAHMEEIDFCWRMKHLGYKIMVCPESKVFHVGGGTLPKKSSFKTYLNMRNNITLLYKNLPSGRLVPVFISRLLLDGIAAFKFLADGGFDDFIAVIRAHMSFYRRFSIHKNKRRLIPHKQVSQVYRGNIVVDYFLKGIRKFSQIPPEKFTR
ncbi:MAG TPA: glycosyltransferase family 2 protein [Lentimicrobium sp.]|nr:glycosyltransferase family 2 protein [Lentimicrobium sp.]